MTTILRGLVQVIGAAIMAVFIYWLLIVIPNNSLEPTGNEELEMEEYQPEEEPGWAPNESEIPNYFPEPIGWSCYYDETYNYDWHDDVLCTNGTQSQRPYLLDGYDFVTYEDVMAAAANYEIYLNSQ